MMNTARVPVFLLVAIGGCATRVYPPKDVAHPVTVYIADYGRHSSVILPTGGKNLVEYTYGDWELYANNKYKWYLGFTKLILTEQGALGRRTIEFVDNEEYLRMRTWAKRLIKIQVEHDAAAALLHELEQIFDSRIETMIINEAVSTQFVRNHARYWLLNTCNQKTAEWLRKLGCEVRGMSVLSNFNVQPPGQTIPPKPERAGPRS